MKLDEWKELVDREAGLWLAVLDKLGRERCQRLHPAGLVSRTKADIAEALATYPEAGPELGRALRGADRGLLALSRLAPEAGLKEEVERAIALRQLAIEENLGLVSRMAEGMRRYQQASLPDAHNDGVLGLIRAVELFNPYLGWAFSTYATGWIRSAMARELFKSGAYLSGTHVATKHLHEMKHTGDVIEALTRKLGRRPLPTELQAALQDKGQHCTRGRAEQILDVRGRLAAPGVSMDARIEGRGADMSGASVGDLFIAQPGCGEELLGGMSRAFSISPDAELCIGRRLSVEAGLESAADRARVQKALRALNHHDRRLIELRFGLNGCAEHTLEELAQSGCATQSGKKVSRQRVAQLEAKVFSKLRRALAPPPVVSLAL